MKKVLSLVLALVMMLSVMMIGANAATAYVKVNTETVAVGELYTADGSKLMYNLASNSDLIVEPGTTIYMVLATNTNDTEYKSNPINKARIIVQDSDSKQVVAKTSSAELKNMRVYPASGNTFVTCRCVAIPVKTINVTVNTYQDWFYCYGDIDYTYKDGTGDTKYFSFTAGYSDNGSIGDIDDSTQVFYYESGDDVYISNDDGDFEIEAVATGKALAKLSMNNDVVDEIEEIYGNYASLVYFNGTGSLTRIKNCKVTIAADGCRYLYKYEDGVLVDLSSYYNSSADAFEMKISGTSYTLGTYVVSDAKLSSVKAPASTTTTTTSSGTAVKPVVPTTSGSTVKPVIPNTGVALELQ